MRLPNLQSKSRMPLFTRIFFVLVLGLGFAGCSHKADETSSSSTASSPQSDSSAPKRYKLTGKIISVDKGQKFAQIAGDDIPGFMGAMTMNYPVIDVSQLDKIGPGDMIAADVVVTPDGFHLENITITKKGSGVAPTQPSSELHVPQTGDVVPNFALTNQDGKRFHLSSLRGDVVLMTFIYTRCPFPNFCPLLSHNFAQIYADSKNDPALGSKMRLLTVSFDPQHDTPAVLRKYAASFRSITKEESPFRRWEFATASPAELKKMSDFFGISYEAQKGTLVHSMSTSVITPDGTIYKWYDDSSWKPNDLMKDASAVLAQGHTSKTNAQVRELPLSAAGSAQAN